MSTQEIRRKFLQYFKNQQHTVIPSSPVVPHGDPTLLFTNAGMNQFKDLFLGKSQRDYSRVATSQKCIRAGGKHNDLENVGHTSRHLTFFEMLGNFSFGDYFKQEAIRFAWEVSTTVLSFDAEKIWASVFRDDDEAFELWKQYLPEKRIVRLEEKDNFWAMGDTGPCGPCSELLYDRGSAFGTAQNPYEDTHGERFFEFWNLVFMQYNRDASGTLQPLPKKAIDTGMGLERAVSLKLGVKTLFETDILRGLIAKTEQICGRKYDSKDAAKAPAFHVVADHLRCLSFAIADGVQPSNIDRGYVLRKILRRAVRYGRQLGMEDPFLAKVLPCLVEMMGEDYPELRSAEGRIAEILTIEEESFIRTLRRGGNILSDIVEDAHKQKRQISGMDAFKLKDTYGFPIEEILLIAKDVHLTVDLERYEALEQEAKERSRSAHKAVQQIASENLFADYVQKHGETLFCGYTQEITEAKITAFVVDGKMVNEMHEGQEGMVILDKTPFYAEMGGQVGDTGSLKSGEALFSVEDTKSPFTGVIAHIGKMTSGKVCIGDSVKGSLDGERRRKIQNNHTATHLLHWALHKVLGEHIRQAGSVVDMQRLRFDFSHHKALSLEEIREIEDLVNEKIRENLPVHTYELAYSEVQKRSDIKQFFGDKYGTKVRVVDIDYSKELCGGTHTTAVGTIGLFRIAKEGSIAAGVRRIEAVTGIEAEVFARDTEERLNAIAAVLKVNPNQLLDRVQRLVEENTRLAQELKVAKKAQSGDLIAAMMSKVEKVKQVSLLAVEVAVDAADLREFADEIMLKLQSGVLALAVSSGETCSFVVRVTNDWVGKGIKASEIIKAIAPIIDGRGGGKSDSAQAGGKAVHKIPEALIKIRELVEGLC